MFMFLSGESLPNIFYSQIWVLYFPVSKANASPKSWPILHAAGFSAAAKIFYAQHLFSFRFVPIYEIFES